MTDLDILARRALAFGLIQDRVRAADGLNRQDINAIMAVTDRKAVVLPLAGTDTVVGSVTLARPSIYASVTDEHALLEWVKANRPEALVVTESVAPWLRDELLTIAKKDGVAVDHTGEVIPGIVVREGQPTVKVIRDKSPEAQAALIEAIFADGVAGVRSLLAIEPPAGES